MQFVGQLVQPSAAGCRRLVIVAASHPSESYNGSSKTSELFTIAMNGRERCIRVCDPLKHFDWLVLPRYVLIFVSFLP